MTSNKRSLKRQIALHQGIKRKIQLSFKLSIVDPKQLKIMVVMLDEL